MLRLMSVLLIFLALHSTLLFAEEPPRPSLTDKVSGHWGEDAVGFRWEENDSRDGRWNETEIGPFLGSVLAIDGQVIPRSLSIKVPDTAPPVSLNYDLTGLQLRGVWSGGFLQFDPTRFGLINPPSMKGELQFSLPPGPAWGTSVVKYRGLHKHQSRVVLDYTVDQVAVLESASVETLNEKSYLVRRWEIAPATHELRAVVGSPGMSVSLRTAEERQILESTPGAPATLRILPHDTPLVVELLYPLTAPLEKNTAPSPLPLSDLTRPGPALWKAEIATHGRRAPSEDAPYVIDTIQLPFRNPWNALFFVSGHDFFSQPGRGALCTAHGDVWLFEGVDRDLKNVSWRRFATGLFQPLGLKIVDDKIYVTCRDQIVRLHDDNADGEADFYECFFDGYKTSPNGHDYVTCLETDSQGNFLFVSPFGVHRVTPDGKQQEIIATGLRNPNGMSVGPGDFITVAPQEGTWTPASAIFEVRPGMHFGYEGTQVTPTRPLGYDPPLCWIPRRMDNSTGGQVWVTSDRWGPLTGQLFNLSFGQCRMQLALVEMLQDPLPTHWPALVTDATTAPVGPASLNPHRLSRQGGLLSFPLTFDSGIMRGRFSPHDGQMYLSGLRGWSTAAVKDGSLQRVRYTGKPVRLPLAVHSFQNGIALTFSTPLDPETASDPGNYFVEQWNYHFSEKYGSPELRPSAPKVQGRDEVLVKSATLLDPATVFLELDDLRPVMQLAVQYALTAADGVTFRDTYYHTLQEIPRRIIDPSRLTPVPAKSSSQEQLEARLKRGVIWRFQSASPAATGSDTRVARMLALSNDSQAGLSPFLPDGHCRASAEGFLQIPLKGSYTFEVRGSGNVRLRIGNDEVLAGEGIDLSQLFRRTIQLRKGYNRFELNYEPLPNTPPSLQVWWSGDDFSPEPIQPASLYHVSDDPHLLEMSHLRTGRELFGSLNCRRCHPASSQQTVSLPEWNLETPDLREVNRRLTPEWLSAWIADPHSIRPQATMPRLLDPVAPETPEQIRDLVAYLTSLSPSLASPSGEETEELRSAGETHFENLGCISCHTFTPPDQSDPWNRLSLHFTKAKFSPPGLKAFILAPHEHYPSNRMPDFSLSEKEAEELTAWVRHNSRGEFPSFSTVRQADPANGARLFQEAGCATCHNHGLKESPPLQFPALATLTPSRNGCLAPDPPTTIPHYALTDSDRNALLRFLEAGRTSLDIDPPAEQADRLLLRFNCAACHDRDGSPSPRLEIIADEGSGKPHDPLPNLTWAGEKFQPEWTTRFLAGKLDYRPRPWLTARMPLFARETSHLPLGFAAQHGLTSNSNPSRSTLNTSSLSTRDTPTETELIEIGRKLTLAGGLDCRQCHGVGSVQPRGDSRTKIALGINFSHVRERLNADHYQRFVLDPGRYDANSRMPRLAADGRTTKINFIFEGDARRQFDAIWRYIRNFDTSTSPASE